MILVGTSAFTVSISALLGLMLGASVIRSISVGFYIVGCLLLFGGFFVGNRGPARVKESDVPGGASGAAQAMGLLSLGSRRLRWATGDEQKEAINMSAVFVVLGFVLILFGIAADQRHPLF
ncbi:MAG TPA: hypothetical protein VF895_06805 [Gaiellaceae bacterium]